MPRQCLSAISRPLNSTSRSPGRVRSAARDCSRNVPSRVYKSALRIRNYRERYLSFQETAETNALSAACVKGYLALLM